MPHVILQPSGSPDARAHYQDTIDKPVDLGLIAQYVTAQDLAVLKGLFPEGRAPTWGVVPGDNATNQRKWERADSGDILFFAGAGAIRATGVVVHKLHNPQLAEKLWGRDEDDETWEFIYFIDQVEPCHIPYADFNKAAGYKPNAVVQGFNVLDAQKSTTILAALDLMQEGAVGGTSEDFALATALPPEGQLDAMGQVLVRKEQGFLRRVLFGRRARGTCVVCGQELPVDLLVAAHLKKRASCTTEEKRDHTNNVVPMCKMGCDDLFERGYLYILDGTVRVNVMRSSSATPTVTAYLAALESRPVVGWKTGMEGYCEAHREQQGIVGQ